MKYIPGFRFTIRNQQFKRPAITTVRDLQRKNSSQKAETVIPELQANVEYEIYHISPKIEKGIVKGVTYKFKGNGRLTDIPFDSVVDAELKLDKILGNTSSPEAQETQNQEKRLALNNQAGRYFNRR